MRPLKLSMTAFGPYANTETIDFNELNERNLFLITGPTGSGKTTIFDAICFAMYGETNGNVRTAESLRSQFADENILTEIELEFELKGYKYNIHRIPRQLRPKSRGEGYTEQKADATLTIFNEKESKVIAGVKNVNDMIEAVIGINAEQFRQIMMIPQGDFRKLLTADSQERERVLQKLFDTSIYNTIQMKMDIQAKSLGSEIRNSKAIRDNIISRLECSDGDRLRLLIDSEDRNVGDIVDEALLSLERDSKLLTELNKKIDEKNKEFHKLIEAKERAKENNEKLKNKEVLKNRIEDKELKVNDVKSLENKVKAGEKARLIIPIEKNYNLRKTEADAKDKELNLNIMQLEKANASFKAAELIYKKTISDEAERRREKLLEEIAKLRGYEDKVKNLKEIKKSIDKAKGICDNTQNQKKKYITEINELKIRIESLRNEKDKAQDASLKVEKVKNEIVRLEDIEKRLIKASKEHEELLHIKEEVNRKEIIANSLKKDLSLKGESYKKMKISFHMNQAAILAKDLEEGQPCPVCGSKHHEKLAKFTENVPTEKELNIFEEELRGLEESYNNKKVLLAELKERESQKVKGCQSMISELSGAIELNTKDLNTKEILNSIELKKKSIIKMLVEARKREEKFTSLSKRYKEYTEKITNTGKQLEEKEAILEKADKKYIEENSKYIELKAVLEGVFKEIPEDMREHHKLKTIIMEREALKKEMLQELKQAREDYEEKKSQLAALKSRCEQIEKDKIKLKEALEEAKKEFRDKCLEAGFSDYKDYNKSRIKTDEIDVLRKEIDAYYKEVHALKQQYDDISKKTQGLKLVDISSFDERINEKTIENKSLIDCRSALSNRKGNNQRLLNEIKGIQSQIGEKERKYNLIGHLAKIAKGDNKARIAFERYVLAAFLEDILVAANLRLRKMTGGRYSLLRTDELERKNKQSGLELEVFDNYTGKSRHVKTLSGGESFKASLSMALGLSDVVQSYAGGVRLDTMFIDEGFGTLDPESLDHAISCLIDLQKSGRLVGIISHVPDLKERIDTRLEVHPTNTGSVTRFVVM